MYTRLTRGTKTAEEGNHRRPINTNFFGNDNPTLSSVFHDNTYEDESRVCATFSTKSWDAGFLV